MRLMLLPLLVTLAGAGGAAPRLTFVRTVAARHDLKGDSAAILYVNGDPAQTNTFVDVLLEQTNRPGLLQLEDATNHAHAVSVSTDEVTRRRLAREHPAATYLGVRDFACTQAERTGERSVHDANGTRRRQEQHWIEAVCRAQVDLIDAKTLRRVESFHIGGFGTSSRVEALTDDERATAMAQAARFAAIDMAEQITPRRTRESIPLDESAPGFNDGWAQIEASRLDAARALWEQQLRTAPASAALHFNLAAVCEALGDTESAEKHYVEARRLSPSQLDYRREYDAFRRRNLLP